MQLIFLNKDDKPCKQFNYLFIFIPAKRRIFNVDLPVNCIRVTLYF